jgi:hypothetical protein
MPIPHAQLELLHPRQRMPIFNPFELSQKSSNHIPSFNKHKLLRQARSWSTIESYILPAWPSFLPPFRPEVVGIRSPGILVPMQSTNIESDDLILGMYIGERPSGPPARARVVASRHILEPAKKGVSIRRTEGVLAIIICNWDEPALTFIEYVLQIFTVLDGIVRRLFRPRKYLSSQFGPYFWVSREQINCGRQKNTGTFMARNEDM